MSRRRALILALTILYVILVIALGVSAVRLNNAHTLREATWQEATQRQGVRIYHQDLTIEQLRAEIESLKVENTALEDEIAALEEDNAGLVQQARPSSSQSYTGGVERWRGLVSKYFLPQYVNDALSVMAGESEGDPNADNGTCKGLFQQHKDYWAARSKAAGFAGASIFDPEANIATSAKLSSGGRDWSHWSVKP